MTFFKRKLHQKLMAAVCGILATGLLFAVFSMSLGVSYVEDAKQQNRKILDRARELEKDVHVILQDLNDFYQDGCTFELLRRMRLDQFQAHHIKDIGFFDHDRLVCTTGVGILGDDVYEKWFDFQALNGMSYSLNVPLVILKGVEKRHIIRLNRFNAVIKEDVFSGLEMLPFKSTVYLWQKGQATPILFWGDIQLGPFTVLPTKPLLFTPRRVQAQNCATDISFCSAVSISYFDILLNELPICIIAALLSMVIGVFIAFTVKSQLKNFFSLKEKIGRGISYDKVICHYQPIISLHTSQVEGCEVLCRWCDDDGKIIMPDKFLNHVQKLNLTWELTEIVMSKAIAELAPLLEKTSEFKIAFNIFPRDFEFRRLINLIDRQKIPDHIVINLELTESEFLEGHDLISSVTYLQERGIKISVDDFGTGYSNLSKLKQLDVDYLKIDKSFVFDMDIDAVRSSLVPHIVEIGKALDIALIAEGVENNKQAEILKTLGVEYAQGFLFSRGVDAETFQAYYWNKNTDKDINVFSVPNSSE